MGPVHDVAVAAADFVEGPGPSFALARLPEHAWGALRKGRSKSFLQHTNAIACADFPSEHPAQGCTGPSESQNFQLSSRVVSELSGEFRERVSVHGCPSFVCLFLFHKGCIGLAQTREGAERRPFFCLLMTQRG